MFKSAKNKEACWKFMSWWTDEQAQYDYGMELEALLGVSGRYITANKAAFERLPWDSNNIADVVGQINAEFVGKYESVNFATVGATSNKKGNGLRFVTRMYLDNIDFENNKVIINDSEYSIVDYGTLIGLEKTNLTLATSIKAKCEPKVYRNIGGVFVDFTAELVNVDSANFGTEFAACGYFTYADSNGEKTTVYTDVITRSVNGIN